MAGAIRILVPGSKSQTQRALIAAALAAGESELVGALDCDDSRALRAGLRQLGVGLEERGDVWRVSGGAVRPAPGPVWCGDGGTTLRFLAPLGLLLPAGAALALDASARLRARPHAALLDALAALGLDSRLDAPGRFVELTRARDAGDEVSVSGGESSQFASALLLVAPRLPRGLVVVVEGGRAGLVSRPYVELTIETMAAFGVAVERGPRGWAVPHAAYRPRRLVVEGDWSSAAFVLAAAQIAGRPVELENLRADSAQGDRAIVGLLAALAGGGTRRLDLVDCPDLLPPLAAACACASAPTELAGVAHARLKESDRVAVLARGLRLAGAGVIERDDGLLITPGAPAGPARLDPAGDHRAAMAFGCLALRHPQLEVLQRECVSKSYPGFWSVLDQLRASRDA